MATAGNADRTTLNALSANLDIGDVADPALRLAYFQYMTDLSDANYQYASGLVSAGTLSRLGIINVKDYNASGLATTATGSITTGTKILTLTTTPDFVAGQGINMPGINEVASLEVTAGATSTANCTVTLNGVAQTVALTNGNTAAQVATAIRAATFTGWTTGGSGTTVTFTSTSTGTKTDATYSAGTTGATGTMSTTTQGVADQISTVSSVSGLVVNIADNATRTITAGTILHDDTVAISNAIDAAKNSGRLIFIPGTYIVSTIFKSGVSNLSIEALIPGTVTIKRKAGTYGNNADTSTSGIITFAASNNIEIRGIIFDGNKANAVPIGGVTATNVLNFGDCDNVLIDNITVTNGHFIGCSLQVCNNQKIINSTFQDCGWAGLNIGGGYFAITGATDVWVENNRFYNTWSGVVVSVYVNRVDVKNNEFVNATCNFSQAVTQSKISGNKFYGKGPASNFGEVAYSAITCESDSDLIIDGNDIVDSAFYGIYVYGSYIQSGPSEGLLTCDRVQITNNKVKQCVNTGILYNGGSPYTYSFVTHTGTPTTEANSTKAKNCIIHGNIVSECTGSGIGMSLSNDVIISNNQTFLNQLNGIILGSCDKVNVKNNLVFNNSKAAVDSYNGIDLGTNTVVINVTISDNEIFDDQATRTQRFGIMVNNASASSIRVRDNVIYGNGGEIYSLVALDPYVITTATLEAGATAQAGYEAPKFYRDGDNIVHLVGSVVVGTDITQRMFTLPIGYRPDAKQRLVTVANGALGIIEVGTDGFVIPVVSTASQYVNLTGLSFKAKPYLT